MIRGSALYDASELYTVYREQLGQPSRRRCARDSHRARGEVQHTVTLARSAKVDDGFFRWVCCASMCAEPRISRSDQHNGAAPRAARSLGSRRCARTAPVTQAGVLTTLQQMRALPG